MDYPRLRRSCSYFLLAGFLVGGGISCRKACDLEIIHVDGCPPVRRIRSRTSQTKRDVKNSNEILRQIAINDNAIFKELKVLLDYKDLQMQEVKTVANTSDERIQNYRRTIKGLQDQNLSLQQELKKGEKNKDLAFILLMIFIGVNGFLVYLVMKKKFGNSVEKI